MAVNRLVWRFSSSFPVVKVDQRPPLTAASRYSTVEKRNEMQLSHKRITAAVAGDSRTRKLPLLLFDIMDTVVTDPFYNDIPAFFGMSMKELLECKHPSTWIEFEKGLINEEEMAQKFFKDGRPIDLEGLKSCMKRRYAYIEGVEELLIDLKNSGYEIHAATNYPIWYEIIEEKLKLSSYLSWTFCSCTMGKRKPAPDFYMDILKHLNVEPSCCIFVDDTMRNVEAAARVGIKGVLFKTADSLREYLWASHTNNLITEKPNFCCTISLGTCRGQTTQVRISSNKCNSEQIKTRQLQEGPPNS